MNCAVIHLYENKGRFYKRSSRCTEKNIQYNGRTVTPYIGGYPDALAAQFGADLEDPNGNMVNIRRTPEYLEALLYLNTMFSEGLITDEQFTENSTQRDQRVAAGNIFAASGWMTVQYPRKSLFSADPNAKMLYAGVINGGDSGKTPILEAVGCGGWTTTMITKNCKNPAKAIQFMSYMTSEKATLDSYFFYDAYDIIDGKVVQKPSIAKELEENYTAAAAKYNMNVDFFVDWTIIEKYTGLDADAPYYDVDHYNQEHDRTITLYDNKAFAYVNPDDGTELAVTRIKIDDYWNKTWPRMVMAKNADECKRMYNEAIAQADSMGMKDLDAYQNGQFRKNKTKLGKTRVWPR
jgi:putative aldouronate transport system substrate-binding protein